MRVVITTGSRLHLGFTNLNEDVGRCYGSLGVALDRPTTRVIIEECAEEIPATSEPEQVRAYRQRFCDYYHVNPRVSISVVASIPPHVGLGSGTQLALAIGQGLATVCGIDAGVWELAMVMGRGRRSGIGVAAFRTGGFIMDAGHRKRESGLAAMPTVIWRRDFPTDWRFVVVVPEAAEGLSGRTEEGVFGAMAPSVRISEEICRLTMVRLMPALIEHDIDEFGRALTAIDRKTGAYFTDVQGGIYGGTGASEAIAALLEAGACGAGQSSWGPAAYGLVHDGDAGRVEAVTRQLLAERNVGATVFVSHGRNTEARVEVSREATC